MRKTKRNQDVMTLSFILTVTVKVAQRTKTSVGIHMAIPCFDLKSILWDEWVNPTVLTTCIHFLAAVILSVLLYQFW